VVFSFGDYFLYVKHEFIIVFIKNLFFCSDFSIEDIQFIKLIRSILTSRSMITKVFLLVSCLIGLSYGLEVKGDEVYVDFKEHPETANEIIKEVKGLKISNIYGKEKGISYSLTKVLEIKLKKNKARKS